MIQTTVFNYTLLTPGLADLAAYRAVLATLQRLVEGLAGGSSLPGASTRCATSNPELDGCVLAVSVLNPKP